MRTKLSCIIPYYNSEKYLENLFSSIASQNIEDVQFIFVDDGSEDDSFNLIESLKESLKQAKEVLNIKTAHRGQAAALSEGLKLSEGDIITWIDSDDEVMDEFFSQRIDFFKSNPDYQMMRNNILVDKSKIGMPDENLFPEGHKIDDESFIKAYTGIDSTAGAGVYAIRSSALFEIYPNREIPFSPAGQNLQLILPTLSRLKCAYIDKVLYKYIQRQDSHSNKKRSICEITSRINDISDLMVELIPLCDYDADKLKSYADEYKKTQMNYYLKMAMKIRRTLK